MRSRGESCVDLPCSALRASPHFPNPYVSTTDNVGYIWGVAKRKKKRRRPSTVGPTPRPYHRSGPSGRVALRKAAANLGAAQLRYREMVVEAYESGLSQREIAALIGRSQPAVSQLLRRAGARRPKR